LTFSQKLEEDKFFLNKTCKSYCECYLATRASEGISDGYSLCCCMLVI